MKITTINSRTMGTTIGGVPSPDRTFLLDGTVDDLPDQGSEGDRAYGLAGAAKGQVFEYSEAAQDWQKIEDAPTELPDASEADPGDVLTVTEDGTWAAAAPSGGGGWPVYTLVYDSDTGTYSLPEGVTYQSLLTSIESGVLPVLRLDDGDDKKVALYFAGVHDWNSMIVLDFSPLSWDDTLVLPLYARIESGNVVVMEWPDNPPV